jgi:hypothetical protein
MSILQEANRVISVSHHFQEVTTSHHDVHAKRFSSLLNCPERTSVCLSHNSVTVNTTLNYSRTPPYACIKQCLIKLDICSTLILHQCICQLHTCVSRLFSSTEFTRQTSFTHSHFQFCEVTKLPVRVFVFHPPIHPLAFHKYS